jgi:hypothetical protein
MVGHRTADLKMGNLSKHMKPPNPHIPPKIEQQQQSMLAHLSKELARIENRDWELWAIVLGTGFAVSVGLLVLMFPAAFLSNGTQLHFEINVSKELFLGLLALLVLLGQ